MKKQVKFVIINWEELTFYSNYWEYYEDSPYTALGLTAKYYKEVYVKQTLDRTLLYVVLEVHKNFSYEAENEISRTNHWVNL